jgi:hypothetical protein
VIEIRGSLGISGDGLCSDDISRVLGVEPTMVEHGDESPQIGPGGDRWVYCVSGLYPLPVFPQPAPYPDVMTVFDQIQEAVGPGAQQFSEWRRYQDVAVRIAADIRCDTSDLPLVSLSSDFLRFAGILGASVDYDIQTKDGSTPFSAGYQPGLGSGDVPGAVEIRASVSISGDDGLCFDDITRVLGVQPTRVRRRQEFPVPRVGADQWDRKVAGGIYGLRGPDGDTPQFPEVMTVFVQVRDLFGPGAQRFAQWRETHDVRVWIGTYICCQTGDLPSFALPSDFVRFAGVLGAGVDYDIYTNQGAEVPNLFFEQPTTEVPQADL